jgi:F-box protein 21
LLSSFKILSQLEELTALCKTYFIERQIPLDPAEFTSDAGKLRLVCSSICDFLWNCGFEAANGEFSADMTFNFSMSNNSGHQFEMLQNRFPHLFLTTHKATIPISLVYVFVCIAQRMGVMAAPVDFPNRVLAIVSSPHPDVSDIFVDVFGSRTQAILTFHDDFLAQTGITAISMLRDFTPASSTAMLVRASRNVLVPFYNFPAGAGAVPEHMLHTAFYASLMVNVIFMNDRGHLLNIMKHINQFLLDLLPVLVDSLAPLLNSHLQEQLTAHCKAVIEDEQDAAATSHPRSALTREVKFFVGMVFKHAVHGYVGYICGWNVGVELACGFHHSFYLFFH